MELNLVAATVGRAPNRVQVDLTAVGLTAERDSSRPPIPDDRVPLVAEQVDGASEPVFLHNEIKIAVFARLVPEKRVDALPTVHPAPDSSAGEKIEMRTTSPGDTKPACHRQHHPDVPLEGGG